MKQNIIEYTRTYNIPFFHLPLWYSIHPNQMTLQPSVVVSILLSVFNNFVSFLLTFLCGLRSKIVIIVVFLTLSHLVFLPLSSQIHNYFLLLLYCYDYSSNLQLSEMYPTLLSSSWEVLKPKPRRSSVCDSLYPHSNSLIVDTQ